VGDVVIDENQQNASLFYVRDGSFVVFVGDTKVATLVRGDWFGEASLLSVFVTRARVVCEKKSSELHVVGTAHLSVVLAARPDLAATFFSVLAYELAIRVNVALIQYARASSDRADISADAHSGRHVIRTVQYARARDDMTETPFRYDAEIHAVRAYDGQRVPKDGAKKKPYTAILYVFSTRVAILYQKGHHQKKTLVGFESVQSFKPEGDHDLVLEYIDDRKKHRTARMRFAQPTVAQAARTFVEAVRGTFKGQGSLPLPPVSMSTAVAVFAFAAQDKSSQIDLVQGHRYTVIDRTGGWLYGYDEAAPEQRGLFPLSFVELRPPGVLSGGCMQSADWAAITFSSVMLRKKGDVVLQEGDATQAGHIFFLRSGLLKVFKKRANGVIESVNVLAPGESVGEMLFLLGGFPRASVIVESETAELVVLPRDKLSALLHEKPSFASPFWKYLCALLYSRLTQVQLRLAKSVPPVPPHVRLVLPEVAGAASHPASPVGAPAAAPVAADDINMSFGIPSGINEAAHAKLLEQLKGVISDDDSSEGDE
jgi:CRP-like cAMP-binding protein